MVEYEPNWDNGRLMPYGGSYGRNWTHFRASRWNLLLIFVCLLQFALLIRFTWSTFHHHKELEPFSKKGTSVAHQLIENSPSAPFFAKAGPWGTLKCVRITLETPEEFVQVNEGSFEKTRWYFSGYTREQLTALFQSCDLTFPQRAELLQFGNWAQGTNAIVVTPGTQLILELNPAARAKIYSALAEDDRNDFQRWPYTYRQGGFEQWFQHSGLSEASIKLVKRLVYTRGSSLCFSDLPEAFTQITSLAERRKLVKTLSRNSTLLVKLQIAPDTDYKALAAYWKGVWRGKDIVPLFESLAEVPDGTSIDLAQVLPPFARGHLNTYPVPDPSSPAIDCYWTAMNFFRDPPDDRYYHQEAWENELNTHYTIVTQPSYGDVVLLLKTNDIPIHAAVYIADDIFFTKNGGNDRQPWMLSKWDDLIARYPDNSPIHPVIFHYTGPTK